MRFLHPADDAHDDEEAERIYPSVINNNNPMMKNLESGFHRRGLADDSGNATVAAAGRHLTDNNVTASPAEGPTASPSPFSSVDGSENDLHHRNETNTTAPDGIPSSSSSSSDSPGATPTAAPTLKMPSSNVITNSTTKPTTNSTNSTANNELVPSIKPSVSAVPSQQPALLPPNSTNRTANNELVPSIRPSVSAVPSQQPAPLPPNTTTTPSNNSTAVIHQKVVAALALSNCHNLIYTAQVGLGTPAQAFTVALDTGSSDTWIPSVACDDTCLNYPHLRFYNASASSSYAGAASKDAIRNGFDLHYTDGEHVKGEHAVDVLHLGTFLTVPQFIFAQATSLEVQADCSGQEGVLGLALSDLSTHNFTALLATMQQQQSLTHDLFSLYMDTTDDYPVQNDHNPQEDDVIDDAGVEEPTTEIVRPLNASSLVIFGGVDHRHYTGCLHWHDVVPITEANGRTVRGAWSMALSKVTMTGYDEELAHSPVAIIDSGTSFIVGPDTAVTQYAVQNQMQCFVEIFGRAEPMDCAEGGFNTAATTCDAELSSLQFVTADGQVYTLDQKDILMEILTDLGPVCILRVLGAEDLNGWILGDAFLNRYYAAFDFGQGKIGLANSAARNGGAPCPEDWPLDVAYDGHPAPTGPPTPPTPQQVAPPQAVPVALPRSPPTRTPKAPVTAPVAAPPSMNGAPSEEQQSLGSNNNNNDNSSSKSRITGPVFFAVVLVVVGLVWAVWSRRRSKQRYRRAGVYDEYSSHDLYMEREMELPGWS